MEASPRAKTRVHAKQGLGPASRLLALSSVQTFADITHFFTRCWPGCDTTSHLFVIAKAVSLKKVEHLYQHAEVFCQPNSLKQETTTAGEIALAEVYGRKRIWRPCDIDGFPKRLLNEQQQLK